MRVFLTLFLIVSVGPPLYSCRGELRGPFLVKSFVPFSLFLLLERIAYSVSFLAAGDLFLDRFERLDHREPRSRLREKVLPLFEYPLFGQERNALIT